MGIYYSLMSVFSSPTSTHNSNVHSSNRLEHRIRSKSLKKRRRRHKRHHLLNRFFLGTNQFSTTNSPQTCLFHEYYNLNSSRETLLPVHLQLTLPESSHSTILTPIQCTMAIRRDSLKLIHCHDDMYSIDFTFDADRPFQLYSKENIVQAQIKIQRNELRKKNHFCFSLFYGTRNGNESERFALLCLLYKIDFIGSISTVSYILSTSWPWSNIFFDST